ncbi:hypothetical protein Pelo_8633 [Pelomyxa schiedti]|nr:hypothetical protein Pelo_8633 [Pelomyxa schiedti]
MDVSYVGSVVNGHSWRVASLRKTLATGSEPGDDVSRLTDEIKGKLSPPPTVTIHSQDSDRVLSRGGWVIVVILADRKTGFTAILPEGSCCFILCKGDARVETTVFACLTSVLHCDLELWIPSPNAVFALGCAWALNSLIHTQGDLKICLQPKGVITDTVCFTAAISESQMAEISRQIVVRTIKSPKEVLNALNDCVAEAFKHVGIRPEHCNVVLFSSSVGDVAIPGVVKFHVKPRQDRVQHPIFQAMFRDLHNLLSDEDAFQKDFLS